MYNIVSISDHYRGAFEKARIDVLRESDAQILGSDSHELAEYYFQCYAFIPIELDSERDTSLEPQSYLKNIPASQREKLYSDDGDLDFLCERIKVDIPIKPNKDIQSLSRLQSTRSFLKTVDGGVTWIRDAVSFFIETKGYGFSWDENRIANEVTGGIEKVHQLIEWKNDDIRRENKDGLKNIEKLIEDRKKEIKDSKDKMQALTKKINIPLKKSIPQSIQKIKLDSKPIIQRIKPNPSLPEEYVLDEGKVNDILDFLDNQARSFERTSKALNSLGEEDLRDLLLANLNSIFEGKATGETFSNKGKTDIYLNIDKGNILVFECKLWGGKKLLHETIDQLRGYLTWRHNFGVIIIFSKIKNFSKIFSEIFSILQEASSYRSGYKKINDTHYSTVHNLDDENKEVKIHYLFYNLFCG